jgi:pyrroloquinoline quinone biosynthesis protein B
VKSAGAVEAVLLGVAQDGGVPQAGCTCDYCQRAHADPTQRQLVVCLGLIDHVAHKTWLIDATPDLREQLHALQQATPGYVCAGILLTHAHMGHYAGLIHLGREAWNTVTLPVYASPTLCGFLRTHAPWSQLVDLGNIALQELEPDAQVALSPRLHVTPVPSPHRNEWSDTVAFVVRGPQRALFYCPDTDDWEAWGPELARTLEQAAVALLDGCFFSADELPGRNLAEIPHPTVVRSVAQLGDWVHNCQISFIHLNHTNPLYHAGPEQTWLRQQCYHVGRTGQWWTL